MNSRKTRIVLVAVLVLALLGGVGALMRSSGGRTHVVGYFDNANGIFVGDDVVILGVTVGKIDKIEPQPDRVKISFWYDDKYKVPADAKAVVLSPNLVTIRALQLTPAYTGGPVMPNGAVLPLARTAVPMEWDDLRAQLEKLTDDPAAHATGRGQHAGIVRQYRGQPTYAARAPISGKPLSSCHRRFRRSPTTAATCTARSKTWRLWCRRCMTAAACCAT